MKLKLVIAENCPACIRAKESLKTFCAYNSEIDLQIENISEFKQHNLSIVPALFVEDELLIYGEINTQKLTELLHKK